MIITMAYHHTDPDVVIWKKYDLDVSISPYAELSIRYDFSGNWNLYIVGRWNRLSYEIIDSSMLESS